MHTWAVSSARFSVHPPPPHHGRSEASLQRLVEASLQRLVASHVASHAATSDGAGARAVTSKEGGGHGDEYMSGGRPLCDCTER